MTASFTGRSYIAMEPGRLLFRSLSAGIHRLLFVITITATIVATSSCRRIAPPRYDRITLLLIREIFAGVEAGNHRLTQDKLLKLGELKPNSPFVIHLAQIESEHLFIASVIDNLENNDVDAALNQFNRQFEREGISQYLIAERKKIVALSRVIAYQKKLPFKDAESAMNAVSELPDGSLFNGRLELYERWQDGQIIEALQMQENERLRLMSEIIHELDVAMAIAPNMAPVILAQAGMLMVGDESYDRWLTSIFHSESKYPAMSVEQLITPRFRGNPAIEILGLGENIQDITHYYGALTLERRGSRQAGHRLEPTSFSGMIDAIERTAYNRDLLRAMIDYRRLVDILGIIDNERLRDALFTGLADIGDIDPFPSVPAVLAMLYRLLDAPPAE